MEKSSPPCHCSYLYERIKRQEEAIAQLVDIIGSTNRRVYELDQRQHGVEHQIVREHPTILQTTT
ncbi:hypothetical protein [Halobacillus sp. BBL2006]|uniref:hypothetical protein n=1 Tax=Halobacillus sp. BBL2006 TaxID=1543706 RepID=UPI00054409B8|nr:hypothetical protein [Halobacillus sp. BBL2006]KHE67539.1 hypothetical protein LD39_16990 [Halobacillus sp. BBL2006]